MGQSTSRSGEMITGINVTPLVDVVLVLLVILMVTSAYIASQTLPLDLPAGSSGESLTTTLAVSLDEQGTLFLDGQRIDYDELTRRASAAHAEHADTRAVIAADANVTHRHVVRVIDTLRGQGVLRYAIQVKPDDGKP